MDLFPNEQKIIYSDTNAVMLTTHRIRYEDSKSLTSIMLDKISSINVSYTSQPIYLGLAIIIGLAGLYMLAVAENESAVAGFVLAAILAMLYVTSRKHVVSISSAAGKVQFHTKGMSKAEVMNFVDKVENAKADYRPLK